MPQIFNSSQVQKKPSAKSYFCGWSAQVGEGKEYEAALRKAQWAPLVFLISVAQTEYMNEKRQRITVRSVGSVDWAAECKLLLESIAKLK
jgi:replication factor A1